MPSQRAGRAGMISLKSISIYLPPTEIRPGTATFFSIICDHEFTTYLTDVVSMVDLDTEPATFIASYNGYRDAHGAGTAAGGTSGVYQGAVEEELPECSATEDLYPGVGCEGRRRSRINGY